MSYFRSLGDGDGNGGYFKLDGRCPRCKRNVEFVTRDIESGFYVTWLGENGGGSRTVFVSGFHVTLPAQGSQTVFVKWYWLCYQCDKETKGEEHEANLHTQTQGLLPGLES